MSSYDTSAVTSSFINSMWGLRNAPSAVTDSELATLLAPYLGTLPTYVKDANGYITSAPFTTNMTLTIHDQVQKFLTDLHTSSVSSATLQDDLTALLAAAQTQQVPVFGQPAPLPPGSGGLARNTASALGSLLASLQADGILSDFTGTSYTVNTANLPTWLSSPAKFALLSAAQAELSQDVPISIGTITVNGVEQDIRVPLNQSLQEVIQTQYVQAGASLVYSGLQALVDQQQGAENAIRALNGLQQVYNGIQVPGGVRLFSDQAALESAMNGVVNTVLAGVNPVTTFSNPPHSLKFSWNDGTGNSGEITYSIGGAPLLVSSTSNVSAPNQAQDIFNGVAPLLTGASTVNQNYTQEQITNFLTTMDAGNPTQYLADLPAALAAFFPKPGTTVGTILLNGVSLSLSVDPTQGNFLWLLNDLYKNYLNQSAQRLIEADSNIMVDPNMTIDPATGQIQLILNPNVASNTTEQHKLLVIRSIQAYANSMNIDGTGTNNLINSSGAIPAASIPLIGPDPIIPPATTVTTVDFGAAISGSLEGSLATILRNLVGPSAIFGLTGTNADDGRITASVAGIDITNWILGNWEGGSSVAGVALDQTQSYLSNAFSSASSLNDALQQQLQQSFFLFQEFMQSATDTLSAINQLIVKKAQAISG